MQKGVAIRPLDEQATQMQHGTSVRLETFNNIPTMADSMEAPQLQ